MMKTYIKISRKRYKNDVFFLLFHIIFLYFKAKRQFVSERTAASRKQRGPATPSRASSPASVIVESPVPGPSSTPTFAIPRPRSRAGITPTRPSTSQMAAGASVPPPAAEPQPQAVPVAPGPSFSYPDVTGDGNCFYR